jgi:hypothetical protein
MKTMLRLLLVVGIVVVPVIIHSEPITQTQVHVGNDAPKNVQQLVPEQSKPTIVSNNTCNPTCICNCYPPKLYAEPTTQTPPHVGNDGPKDVPDKGVTADKEKNPVDKIPQFNPPQVVPEQSKSIVVLNKEKNPVDRPPQFDPQQPVPEQSKSIIVSNNTCNPTCICNCYPPKSYMENGRGQ